MQSAAPSCTTSSSSLATTRRRSSKMFDGSNTFTVPTTAERTGDFSADALPSTIPRSPTTPTERGSRSPATTSPIPIPIALKFLSEFPKCNYRQRRPRATRIRAAQSTTSIVPGLDPTTAQRFDIRIDWAKSEKQRIFGRFSFDRLFTSTFNAFGNMWDLNYAQNVTNGRNVLIADDLTLSPTTVLQLRYSFTRHYENQGGDPRQSRLRHYHSWLSVIARRREKCTRLLPFVNLQRRGRRHRRHRKLQHLPICQRKQRRQMRPSPRSWASMRSQAGFEYMKRFLNVGQPPAPSGSYPFDISATDQTRCSYRERRQRLRFVPRRHGNGARHECNRLSQFHQGSVRAEASPYYAAFVEDTYHPTKASPSQPACAGISSAARQSATIAWSISIPAATTTVAAFVTPAPKSMPTAATVLPLQPISRTSVRAWASHGSRSASLVVRGGGGFYFGPSPQMVGGVRPQQRRLFRRHQLECHLL